MLGLLLVGLLLPQTGVALSLAICAVLMILLRWMEARSVHVGRLMSRAFMRRQSELSDSSHRPLRGDVAPGPLPAVRSSWRSRILVRETLYDDHVLTASAGSWPVPVPDAADRVRFRFGRWS